MKYIKLFLPVLLIFWLLPSCNQQPEIGLLMDTIERDRWEKDRDLFVEKVNELGGEVTVRVANSDASVQFQQALKMINSGIDVLVISLPNIGSRKMRTR